MHAYGDAENLKLDLTSQPKLSQDDIFLLLTVGLTRAELDQAQSASLGESVALEALGSLTGADSAVSEAIPAIDEFRFGSAYSARTGRTEPTVTVGKRLSERIRAYASDDGSIVWTFDTNREFETVNGVKANGGAMDGPGVVVEDGMIYATSGYVSLIGRPGNVVLAFGVE